MSPPFLASPILPVPHGFFGREGGVSKPPFDSLNASLASGDGQDAVEENRALVAEALGAEHLLTARQTHSDRAVFVEEPFTYEARPEADALVTTRPGLALGALAADCTPVLFYAPGMVAAAHAGWRGSLAGIIASTLDLMRDRGAGITDIRAVIGPCLRQKSFEVREDLIQPVLARYPDAARHFYGQGGETSLYDHAGFVRDRLLDGGVLPVHVDDTGGDSLSEEARFFSYRRARAAGEERFGHNVSAIVLP